MSDKTLKQRAVKGITWSAIEKFGSYAISFVIGIVIARILMPSDYGLIGMLAIFIGLSELFVNSGFSSALIQKKDRTDVDFSTIFYFNLFVAILFYFILFLSAPIIANFYRTPQLIVLTRILSISIIINSLSLVQETRLLIKLDLKSLAIVTTVSNLLSGGIGILTAQIGFGVWALVMQKITFSFLRASLLAYFNKWSPLLIFSWSSFRQLFGFSSKLLGSGILATFFNNIYSVIIGKVFRASDLGFYAKSKQFSEILPGLITSIHHSVSYPVLSTLQDDKERLVSVYGKFMRMIMFFVIPTMTLFAMLSGPFIRFILTEKWAPSIVLLQWLCFARMITPISSLNMNILNAIGRSDLYFKVDISKIPIMIIALVITIPIGLKAVVIGNFITTFISFFINAYYPGKFFGFGAVRQLKEMGPIAIATIVMLISAYLIQLSLSTDFLKLLVCLPLSIIVFLIMAYIIKIEELDELFQIVKSYYKGLFA